MPRHSNFGIGQQNSEALHHITILAMFILVVTVWKGMKRWLSITLSSQQWGGDVKARHNLGVYEACAGNMERALKHLMIAAEFGHTNSLEVIKKMFSKGYAICKSFACISSILG